MLLLGTCVDSIAFSGLDRVLMGCLTKPRLVAMLTVKRILRIVGLLCVAAVGFQVVTFFLPAELLQRWSIKDHFWNGSSHSESHGGLVGKDASVVTNGNDLLVNPGSVWPVADQLDDDRFFSQLEALTAYAKTRNISSTKVILRVGTFNFNHLNWRDGQKHLVEDGCPITNCLFTSNQSLFQSADAVVISEFSWKDVDRLLPKAAYQVWVAFYMEPPHQRPLNSKALGGYVNWTMSYRPDSTIVTPYGKWIPVSKPNHTQTYETQFEVCRRNCSYCPSNSCLNCFYMNCTDCTSGKCKQCKEVECKNCTSAPCANCSEATCTNCLRLNCSPCSPQNCTNCSYVNCTRQASAQMDIRSIPIVNYAKGRTKKVAMFVSNWKDRNGRRRYAWELGKYIDVDVYGDQDQSLLCPRSEADRCHDMLKKDYKFYLAFENSNCIGYITEKLHRNALGNDVIPIVMGARADEYAKAAPPGSYIHVEDFQSPRHLAEYLNQLDANDTLYNEYFRYKDHFRFLDMLETRYWCRLCGLLHLRDYMNYVNWYKDFHEWTTSACSKTKDGRWPWKTWKKGNTETSFSKELVEILLSMVK